MEPVKKTDLQREIVRLEVQIQIEQVIRDTIDKFKHYKQVNKRFTDAFEQVEGYRAWMVKDYSHKIAVQKTIAPFKTVTVELYVYGEEFSWATIIRELDRCNFKGQLKQYQDKLETLDADIETLKRVLAFVEVETCEMKNFHVYSLKSELRHAIEYSGE